MIIIDNENLVFASFFSPLIATQLSWNWLHSQALLWMVRVKTIGLGMGMDGKTGQGDSSLELLQK